MNLPAMRRGLSPEGRRIRERHQGTLTIGLQGTAVHPAERGYSQRDFLQENVRRLREIQARCRERDNNKRCQPLRVQRDRETPSSPTMSPQPTCPLASVRNGSAKLERSDSYEREGSTHSDYYSLTEEQIEPLVNHYHQVDQNRLNQSMPTSSHRNSCVDDRLSPEPGLRNSSSSPSILSQSFQSSSQLSTLSTRTRPRSGSVILKPIASRPTQTTPMLTGSALRQSCDGNSSVLPESELSIGMRKMRMGNLMSKIKKQKPSCEMDFNAHYKSIENQHRLLLDSSDILSLYGSGEGSTDMDSQRSVRKSETPSTNDAAYYKMTRAKSFDRGLLNKRNSPATPKTSKEVTANSNRKNLMKNSPKVNRKNKSPSENIPKNSNSNTRKLNKQERQTISLLKGREVTNHDILSPSSHATERQALQGFQRSKSNVEIIRKYPISTDSPLQSDGYVNSVVMNSEEKSRACENYLVKEEEVNSNTGNLDSTISTSDFNIAEYDQSLPGAKSDDFRLDIPCESQSEGDILAHIRTDQTQEYQVSEPLPVSYDDDREAVNDEGESGEKDAEGMKEMRTSTPVLRNSESPVCNTPSKLLKRREQQAPTTTRSTLTRSQSAKNLHQQPGDPPPTYKRGKLPKYLLARKEEEKRLAEIAQAVDPECPPGHAPLPDHERRNTLHLLKKSQAEVMRELSSLPVAQDTLRVKKLRNDLEAKLMQIEDGMRIFSQPKVYVMNDE